ncbi:hypothetical protein GCM10010302_29030 [Streptomyces polychromogenes]|uniref:Uncharacterized protein n=1 Tax=Streptomyces polychromogenes TaxID=67342 RepID=A0ABN0VCW5_9ACTN
MCHPAWARARTAAAERAATAGQEGGEEPGNRVRAGMIPAPAGPPDTESPHRPDSRPVRGS